MNITQNINLSAPFNSPPGVGSALQVIDPNFKSGRVLSYNFNIQQEVAWHGVSGGLRGQPGPAPAPYRRLQSGHRRQAADFAITSLNASGQPVAAAGGSMTIQESVSNSNYNGLWLSAEKRLAKGLTFNTSYTFPNRSITTPSAARIRRSRTSTTSQRSAPFPISTPASASCSAASTCCRSSGTRNGFTSRLSQGWSIAPIVNLQSGNPFSPIIPTADPSSLLTFDRPNLVAGQPLTLPNPTPSQWLNKAAFVLAPPGTFGNAGRNILTAPGLRGYRLRGL